MDVEERTTVSAGLNMSGVTGPLKEAGDFFTDFGEKAARAGIKATAEMSKAGKAALDGGRAFRSLAGEFINSYKETTTFIDKVQKLYNAIQNGDDKLKVSGDILRKLSQSYGLVGSSAAEAALKMIKPGEAMEDRLVSMQSILAEFQARANAPIAAPAVDDSAIQKLANEFIEGRAAASAYAGKINELETAFEAGSVGARLYGDILDGMNAKFQITGGLARQAALAMVDVTASAEQRQAAMASLIATMQARPQAILPEDRVFLGAPGQQEDYLRKQRTVTERFHTFNQNLGPLSDADRGIGQRPLGDAGFSASMASAEQLARQYGLLNSAVEQYQATVRETQRLVSEGFLSASQGAEIEAQARDRVRASLGLQIDQLTVYQTKLRELDAIQREGLITARERDRLASVASVQTGQIAGRPVAEARQFAGIVNQYAGVTEPVPQAPQAAGRIGSRQQDLEDVFGPGGQSDQKQAEDQEVLRRELGLTADAMEQYAARLMRIAEAQRELGISTQQVAQLQAKARQEFGVPHPVAEALRSQRMSQETVDRFAGVVAPAAQMTRTAQRGEDVAVAFANAPRLVDQQIIDERKFRQRGQVAQETVNRFAGVVPDQDAALRSEQRRADVEAAFGPMIQQEIAAEKALNAQLEQDLRTQNQIYAASKDYEAALERIGRLRSANKITAQQEAAFTEQETARFSARNQPLQSGPVSETMKAQADAAKSAKAHADALDQERRAIDPIYATSKRYEEALEAIDRQEKAGNITAVRAAQLREQETEGYNRVAAPMGRHVASLAQVSFFTRQLGVQTVQTFQGFATGQPILTTLIQQGHQVADVWLSTGVAFKDVQSAFARAFAWIAAHPIVLVIGGIAAAIAALTAVAVHGESVSRRLLALQNTLRGTLQPQQLAGASDQVDRAARRLNATTNISYDEAFQAGAVIRQNPAFQGDQAQLESLIKSANELRQILGSDLPTATQVLVKGFDDAAGAAEELRQKVPNIRGITALTVEQLRHTAAVKGSAAAMEEFRRIIDGVTAGGVDNTTRLVSAWREFLKLTTGEGTFWRDIGKGIADGVGVALEAVNALLRGVQALVDALKALSPSGGHGFDVPEGLSPGQRRAFIQRQGELVRSGQPVEGGAPGNNLVGLRPAGQNTGFQTFAKPEDSIAQGIRQLQIYEDRDKLTTLRQQITKWAPPNENKTAEYIARVAKETGMDPDKPYSTHDQEAVRKVITSMAGVETGKTVNQEIIGRGVTQAFTQGAATGPSGTTGGTRKEYDDAIKASENATNVRRKANLDEQIKTQRALDAATKTFDESYKQAVDAGATPQQALQNPQVKTATEEMLRHAETLDRLKGEYTNILTPLEQYQRDLKDANAPLAAAAGAARTLAEEENRLRLIARASTGELPSQAEVTAALTERQKALTVQFQDSVTVIKLNTGAQIALTTATEEGGKFLEHATNFENARIQALQTAAVGTKEYARQVIALTDALDAETKAKRDNIAAADISRQKDELEVIHAEISLLTERTEVRNRELAAIQKRQQLNIKPGETPTVEEQKTIDYAKAAADYKTYADSVRRNTQELEQFTDQIGSTITDAITAPWKEGETAMQRWANVGRSIVNDLFKEFLKLGVTNPLKNALFGGDAPTLDSIGNVFGKKKDPPVPGAGSPLAGFGGAFGGLPIDPLTNAMRVTVVGSNGLTGANDNPLATNDQKQFPGGQIVPPIPANDNVDTQQALANGTTGADLLDSRGNTILPPIPPVGGGSTDFAGGGVSDLSLLATTAESVSGGTQASDTGGFFNHFGGPTGYLVDRVGGDGFYKGGGLIGSLFGSSDTASGSSVSTSSAESNLDRIPSINVNTPKQQDLPIDGGSNAMRVFIVNKNLGGAGAGGSSPGGGPLGGIGDLLGKGWGAIKGLFGSGASDAAASSDSGISPEVDSVLSRLRQENPDISALGPASDVSGISSNADSVLANLRIANPEVAALGPGGGLASAAGNLPDSPAGGGFFSGIGDAISGAWDWVKNLFAAGTMEVPHDMHAVVHQGEIILPASHANVVRQALPDAGFGDITDAVLAHAASAGRGNDSLLAHINPAEAEMLKSVGGSGKINPATGLPEFDGGPWGPPPVSAAPVPQTLQEGGAGTGSTYSTLLRASPVESAPGWAMDPSTNLFYGPQGQVGDSTSATDIPTGGQGGIDPAQVAYYATQYSDLGISHDGGGYTNPLISQEGSFAPTPDSPYYKMNDASGYYTITPAGMAAIQADRGTQAHRIALNAQKNQSGLGAFLGTPMGAIALFAGVAGIGLGAAALGATAATGLSLGEAGTSLAGGALGLAGEAGPLTGGSLGALSELATGQVSAALPEASVFGGGGVGSLGEIAPATLFADEGVPAATQAALTAGKAVSSSSSFWSQLKTAYQYFKILSAVKSGAQALIGGGSAESRLMNLGSAAGSLATAKFAQGGVFDEPRHISAHSNTIVTSPTLFRFATGSMGLMGEAGPEAIMPVSRMPHGGYGLTATDGSKVPIERNHAGVLSVTPFARGGTFDEGSVFNHFGGNDEFAAILQRGERVLAPDTNDRFEGIVSALAGRRDDRAEAPTAGPSVVMNIQTPDANSFARSRTQIEAKTGAALSRAAQRNSP